MPHGVVGLLGDDLGRQRDDIRVVADEAIDRQVVGLGGGGVGGFGDGAHESTMRGRGHTALACARVGPSVRLELGGGQLGGLFDAQGCSLFAGHGEVLPELGLEPSLELGESHRVRRRTPRARHPERGPPRATPPTDGGGPCARAGSPSTAAASTAPTTPLHVATTGEATEYAVTAFF